MLKNVDINKFLKLLMIILSVVFMATSCSYNENLEDNKNSAMPQTASDEDISGYANEQRTCWQTSILSVLYKTMGEVSLGMYTKITDGALAMMMMAFAIWLSIRLLKHVSSFTEENMGEVWSEVLQKLFVCIVCGLLASSTENILFLLNSIIFPIYNAFLEFGSVILAQANEGKSGGTVTFTTKATVFMFGETWELGKPIICKAAKMTPANLSAFPDSPREMMECMICAVNERMNLGYALSFKVLRAPGVTATVIGLFILGCFTIVKLGFVFYLVDSIFKFTVIMVMLPILIMSFAFKKTKKWASFGFFTVLNSAAFMMFVAIMMAMALLAMEQVMRDNADIFVEGEDYRNFREFSVPFICLMLIGFLIVSSINIAQEVSSSLVGGSGGNNFQKKVVVIAKMVGSWITGGVSGAIGKIGVVKKAKAKAGDMKNKFLNLAGRGTEE